MKILSLEQIKRELVQLDWWLIITSAILSTIGSIAIYSINRNNPDLTLANYWWQHLVTVGLGIGLLFLLARWPYDRLLSFHWVIYGLTNISLIFVLFYGTIESGAQSWLTLGGFNIQPSEFAKISLIITIAALIHPKSIQTVWDMIRILLVVFPSWLLVLIQPDLGTAIVLGIITLGMLHWGGTPLHWLLLLCSPLISATILNSATVLNFSIPYWLAWIATIGCVAWFTTPGAPIPMTIGTVVVNLVGGELGKISWNLLHPYQRERLILFLDPNQDPLGGGYHLIQSRIAIGAGQFWGKGFLQGSQTQLNFIPEQHTDFVFSAIGEEWGFIGCIGVVILFFVLCSRLLVIAMLCRDNFGSLLAIGLLWLILLQTFVNIGMTIGLAPVTGLPLPFLSYGRSALIAYFLGLGIVESVVVVQRP